nr:MAG TPA: hypothetical protein [Caudoviricetes sp.]
MGMVNPYMITNFILTHSYSCSSLRSWSWISFTGCIYLVDSFANFWDQDSTGFYAKTHYQR